MKIGHTILSTAIMVASSLVKAPMTGRAETPRTATRRSAAPRRKTQPRTDFVRRTKARRMRIPIPLSRLACTSAESVARRSPIPLTVVRQSPLRRSETELRRRKTSRGLWKTQLSPRTLVCFGLAGSVLLLAAAKWRGMLYSPEPNAQRMMAWTGIAPARTKKRENIEFFPV